MSEEFPMDLLPKTVWEYVALCSECTESPEEFHVAGALFITSLLVGSWTTINCTKLNNYYLLIGDTGTTKKSTAQNLAIKMCREIFLQNPDLNYRSVSTEENSEKVTTCRFIPRLN